ncbi:hypothetical protein PAPYR_4530 [Paratrimastix pyriformis]|uniref:Transmembrane protein n=1 Tax=Paratrimastix pyriformis TaxID=342808 RepID=A0ABQ8UN99_9EUKA|nr:hypothetical protein PAPYR_4530 [Paratrimastix pyriformis]
MLDDGHLVLNISAQSFYIGKSLVFLTSSALLSMVIWWINGALGPDTPPSVTPITGSHVALTTPSSDDLVSLSLVGQKGPAITTPSDDDYQVFFNRVFDSIREQIPPVTLSLQAAISQLLTAVFAESDALYCSPDERFWQGITLVILFVVSNLSELFLIYSPHSLHRKMLLVFSRRIPAKWHCGRHVCVAWGSLAFWVFKQILLAEWLLGFSYKPLSCLVEVPHEPTAITAFRVGHQVVFCGLAMHLGMVLVAINTAAMGHEGGSNPDLQPQSLKRNTQASPRSPGSRSAAAPVVTSSETGETPTMALRSPASPQIGGTGSPQQYLKARSPQAGPTCPPMMRTPPETRGPK